MELNYYFVVAGISILCLLVAIYFNLNYLSAVLKALTTLTLWLYCFELYLQQPSKYSSLILSAISFGVIGDLLLIGTDKKRFLFGMLAFALGHVAYCIAFWRFTFQPIEYLSAAMSLSVVMYSVYRWLKPKIPQNMRLAVVSYMVVLGLMCSIALSARYEGHLTLVAMGATLFLVSDLFVATYRFNKPQFYDKLIGLPLYFTGQFILATSILQLSTNSRWLPI
jgi:uncharacterized membrane protein YhhN